MNYDLRMIKRYYGEQMMHLCRKSFSTILENEGLLFRIIDDNFAHNKFLYDDIVDSNLIEEFIDFIYEKYDSNNKDYVKKKVSKTPFQLLKEAGYTLYECKSEEDIQKFKKYYAPGEELCTFTGGRLNNCYVFFAVKYNAADIKREDFPNPDRQDEYGTSVISIQYHRGERNTLSVKNRYNHTVDNPDATFSNNLDNIVLGLNDSFEETYNLSHTGSHNKFEMINYVKDSNGKFYRYNYEMDNIYYCTDNIILDGYEVVSKYRDKEKYIVMDYFVIDLVNKKISSYKVSDKYIDNLNNIKKIEIEKNKIDGNKNIILIMNNDKKVVFVINKFNQIIKIYDEYTKEIPNSSLMNLKYLRELSMPNVINCGDLFLSRNMILQKIEMPNIESVGNQFLSYNKDLPSIDFPKLKTIGDHFMRCNEKIMELYLPSVLKIGASFMDLNRNIVSVNLPNVHTIDGWFMSSNSSVTTINMPKLESVLSNFLSYDKVLKKVNLPNLVLVRNNFLQHCMTKEIYLPKLRYVGDYFMQHNTMVQQIDLPNVASVGSYFISDNMNINTINMPNLSSVDSYFLLNNEELEKIELPNLLKCGDEFLSYNKKIKYVYLPNIIKMGDRCLYYGFGIEEIKLDSVIEIGTEFLYDNRIITKFIAPKLEQLGENSLYHAKKLECILANGVIGFDNNSKCRKLVRKID